VLDLAAVLAELLILSDFPPEYALDRIQHGCDWKQNIALYDDILY
jgi:hypothetical protein